MNKIAIKTVNNGTLDMVSEWDLIPEDKSIPSTTEIAVTDIPNDFYYNFLDYYIDGSNLNKLSTPVGATMNRPVTDFNYPFAAVRANSFNIFRSL